MKTLQLTLTEKQCKNFTQAHKRNLMDDGGLDRNEVKDITICEALSYAIYERGEYIGAALQPEFILVVSRVSKEVEI